MLWQAGPPRRMYATVNVQLPAHLTKQQRQHYEALAKLGSGTKHSAA